MADPSIDTCLDLVFARIHKTAAPFTLSPSLEKRLRDGLRPDFTDALKTPGSWGLYGPTVLRMAGFVGCLARFFAERTGRTAGALSERHVLLAFTLVKPLCALVEDGTPLRAQDGEVLPGRYCQNFKSAALDDALGGFLGSLA
jgi:hypothetical protein